MPSIKIEIIGVVFIMDNVEAWVMKTRSCLLKCAEPIDQRIIIRYYNMSRCSASLAITK